MEKETNDINYKAIQSCEERVIHWQNLSALYADERNELRAALEKIVACGLNCKDALDEAEQMERIAKDALSGGITALTHPAPTALNRLVLRLRSAVAHMAPHQKERDNGRLIIESLAEIEALTKRFTKLDKPKYSGEPMMDSVLATTNPDFRAWVDSLPPSYWARYDLSAARNGSPLGSPPCSESLNMSKRIPARTKTLTASWCRKVFLAMSPEYRAIRAKTSKPMDTCHWCRHKFADGEMMALAAVHGSGNKVLCQSCADELLSSLSNADVHGDGGATPKPEKSL